jgi:hypothetical protein
MSNDNKNSHIIHIGSIIMLDDGAVWIWNVLQIFRETCQGRLILLIGTKAMTQPTKSGRKKGTRSVKIATVPNFHQQA